MRSRLGRLLKNTHLLRCPAMAGSLQRTEKYASFLMMSRVLHLSIFEQPVCNYCLLFETRRAGEKSVPHYA
jgi:hypothetical protein